MLMTHMVRAASFDTHDPQAELSAIIEDRGSRSEDRGGAHKAILYPRGRFSEEAQYANRLQKIWLPESSGGLLLVVQVPQKLQGLGRRFGRNTRR
jgi:hypothetical protein